MPDGTSRLSKDGKQIYHFMGCSTFAEYAVIAGLFLASFITTELQNKRKITTGILNLYNKKE
jgi:Zn-dependent alcohol dehydrogenase